MTIFYWLMAMGILLLSSAFFSSSEAALFYLSPSDRRKLANGNSSQRMAAALLDNPDRLLTAVLFWNLLVNVAYFTIASIASIRLEQSGYTTEAGAFAVIALLTIILCSEMLPKSLAVLHPRGLASLVSVPLTAMVRLLDPIQIVLRQANTLSRRVLWPNFEPEQYLQIGDLERAVELSTSDATLLEQEQLVLQSIVSLSNIRTDEIMRPRTQFLSFKPPVALADLKGNMPPSGYLLITEPDSDEIAAAIPLRRMSNVPTTQLEQHAEPVVYVPWCTTVAEAAEEMQQRNRQVAAVVNELGETIGILTFDDILDTIFSRKPSRSRRLLHRMPITQIGPNKWHVTGMTSLRRLVRQFKVRRPPSKTVTVAGVIQEKLQRLPQKGDVCQWGPFCFKVIDVPDQGRLLVELTLDPGPKNNGEQPL